MRICANCGAHQPEDAAFCDECGAPLRGVQDAMPPAPASVQGRTVVASSVCPTCGAQISLDNPFCTNCGAALREVSHPASVATPGVAGATVIAVSAAAPAARVVPEDEGTSTGLSGESARTAVEGLVCTQCGAALELGSAYCDQCGAPIGARGGQLSDDVPTQVPEPVASGQPYPGSSTMRVGALDWDALVPPAPAPAVTGRLIVQATGAILPLPPGKIELLIGREDPVNGVFPDIDLTDHGGDEGGVSRKHARLTVQGGRVDVEDLNSVNATFLNGVRLVFGEQRALSDGDELRLGRVALVFRTS